MPKLSKPVLSTAQLLLLIADKEPRIPKKSDLYGLCGVKSPIDKVRIYDLDDYMIILDGGTIIVFQLLDGSDESAELHYILDLDQDTLDAYEAPEPEILEGQFTEILDDLVMVGDGGGLQRGAAF
jgi:hypothetical protein